MKVLHNSFPRSRLAVLGLVLLLGAVPSVQSQTFTNLHSFMGEPNDGRYPYYGALMPWGTNLYGMTDSGGSNYGGVIFRMNIDGSGYTNLFNFGGDPSIGRAPLGALTRTPGGKVFYGMTSEGGIGLGVVFRILLDGSGYANLHYFSGVPSDGASPCGDLTLSGTNLYGVTQYGGVSNNGVVFRLNTDGSGYTILHHFSGGDDGANPEGALTLDGASLYGATGNGGWAGNGTIYKIQTDGSGYTLLRSLSTGLSDGSGPVGSLAMNGTQLFGVTVWGGINNSGVVFRINTDGSGYTNLHRFAGGVSDGAQPFGSPIVSGSTIYGTTRFGGGNNSGTLFKVHIDGSGFTLLHSFAGGARDGADPWGTPALNGTALYGMTQAGGTSNSGTIFALKVAPTVSVLLQQGAGGVAGRWLLGPNYLPATWNQMGAPLDGAWVTCAMRQNHTLLQQGTGGLTGLWDLNAAATPTNWWPVYGPLAGWIMRDYDSGRIMLQQGDGGPIGIWTLSVSNQPAIWTPLCSKSVPGLIARSLCGNRVLLQYGSGTPIGFWTLDGSNNVTIWTQINTVAPAGWILRSLSPTFILLQAGDGGMAGLWELDSSGQPFLWHPITGSMSGWILHGIDEQ